MTGNDQKSVSEYHLDVRTVMFCDLGCPGRYSSVLESDFHEDSQNPKVGYGGEIFEKIRKFPKVTKLHEMTGNDKKIAWEHHLGVGTINFWEVFWRR